MESAVWKGLQEILGFPRILCNSTTYTTANEHLGKLQAIHAVAIEQQMCILLPAAMHPRAHVLLARQLLCWPREPVAFASVHLSERPS